MRSWCAKHIRIVPPNSIIAEDYLRKAEEALGNMSASPSTEWKVISAYYACYDALYALLQHAGIICENHDCTIELMPLFGFSEQQTALLRDLKQQRINAQYYVDRPYTLRDQNVVKGFVLECKRRRLTVDTAATREKIKSALKK